MVQPYHRPTQAETLVLGVEQEAGEKSSGVITRTDCCVHKNRTVFPLFADSLAAAHYTTLSRRSVLAILSVLVFMHVFATVSRRK